jgi:hypothetical protein
VLVERAANGASHDQWALARRGRLSGKSTSDSDRPSLSRPSFIGVSAVMMAYQRMKGAFGWSAHPKRLPHGSSSGRPRNVGEDDVGSGSGTAGDATVFRCRPPEISRIHPSLTIPRDVTT